MSGRRSDLPGYDGKVEETYLAPATRRKGKREYPGWKDPDWSRQNWAYVRKTLRRYFILLMAPLLFLLWGAGYAQGLISSAINCREIISTESSK